MNFHFLIIVQHSKGCQFIGGKTWDIWHRESNLRVNNALWIFVLVLKAWEEKKQTPFQDPIDLKSILFPVIVHHV